MEERERRTRQEQRLHTLQTALRERRHVTLYSKADPGWGICGYVLGVGERLVLFASFPDFQPNGLRLIPLRSIAEAEIDSDFRQGIAQGEGLYERIGEVPAVRLDSWQSALGDLLAQDAVLAIYLKPDGDSGDYAAGKLLRTGARAFAMRRFDADGVWEEEPSSYSYSRIETVALNDRYLLTYLKYIKPIALPLQCW